MEILFIINTTLLLTFHYPWPFLCDILYGRVNMQTQLPDTVHSCSQHSIATARLTSEQPGTIIPVLKNVYSVGR